MTSLTQKQIEEETRLKETIENAILVAFSKIQPFSFCAIENKNMQDVQEALVVFKKLLVGNGNVEDGLMWKQQQNIAAIVALREEMLTKKDMEARVDPFTKFVKYAVDKVLPPLITTGIIALIGFLFMVNQHIILVKAP